MAVERLRAALAAIDRVNAGDPNTLVVDGVELPKEPTHARMMSDWLVRLDPGADEEQAIAARAHHLRRWSVPRSSYPEGRSGYLRWRASLQRQQAAEVADLLAPLGYDEGEVGRVQDIIQKRGLGTDPAVQTHEDALCLVFLTTQLDALAAEVGDTRIVNVLTRTLAKMSARGRAVALDLPLSDHSARLLRLALDQSG